MLRRFFKTGKRGSKPSSAEASGPGDATAGSAVATGHRALGIALQHHQGGRIAEAEAVYRQILASDPGNFDALHLLGVAAYQLGRYDEAAERILQALALNPNDAPARNNLGNVLRVQGWQSGPQFYGLRKRADVYLDTIGFSGFNTAMQALECGLTIATMEGRFMRGRLASGLLRRIGSPGLVAASKEDYVALGVRLAADAGYRQSIRERIEASHNVLFEDLVPIRALENFLTGVVRR